jgi:hypothetical protein
MYLLGSDFKWGYFGTPLKAGGNGNTLTMLNVDTTQSATVADPSCIGCNCAYYGLQALVSCKLGIELAPPNGPLDPLYLDDFVTPTGIFPYMYGFLNTFLSLFYRITQQQNKFVFSSRSSPFI